MGRAGWGATHLEVTLGQNLRFLAAAMLTLFGLGLARLTGVLVAPDGVTAATKQLLATDFGGATLCTVAFLVSRGLYPLSGDDHRATA